MYWSAHMLEAVKELCVAWRHRTDEEYDGIISYRVLESAERIVLESKPGVHPAVLEAAEAYLVHGFTKAREYDLKRFAKRDGRDLPDFRS